mmetsp:Transcript_55778/g.103180  ORF Transcript_55778/g.103180 Transcript_55778/m.103180 type:complete len:353 (+) Transcript_55778:86-1144(+)
MGVGRCCCTGSYLITWLILLAALACYHVSLLTTVPEMQDFPTNLRDGIDNIFKFDLLEEDASVVKAASAAALLECNFVADVACNPVVINNQDISTYQDQGGNIQIIIDAFDRSLGIIEKVTNDKYLGTDELEDAAAQLRYITGNLTEVQNLTQNGDALCQAVKEGFCSMYNQADDLADGVSDVTAELDKWTESDEVKAYEDNADYMVGLHAAPYFMVLGAFFFGCMWWRNKCCKGCSGVCGGLLFFIMWFIFFVIQTIVTALCVAVVWGQDQVEIDFLKDKPTLEDVINHIKAEYPEFWNAVFADMEEGLEFFYFASLLFELFAILIIVYAAAFCCCGKCCYGPGEEEKESS